ncbi:MAG: radical SAM protein [Hyphomicrobiales bacterium]|nr:radical SAM protein [Hyphomicrobiales bacterium]
MEALTSKQDSAPPLAPGKFVDPDRTAKGEPRAAVPLAQLETLWFNTGTLCNIACVNCYIESDPRNDRLEYITAAEAAVFLDEIEAGGFATREIGFTGGEPFLNPDMLAMASDALKRGFEVLILTNAMKPMQRPRIKAGLLELKARHGGRLKLRVSLDHYTQELHGAERGPESWQATLDGIDWLAAEGFRIAVAGRTCWQEPEGSLRAGYRRLFAERGLNLDARNAGDLVLFPEMNERLDVAEITTACWGILGVDPSSVMCATSRMVVKRKGAARPAVLPCTLIAYDSAFEMGASLEQAARANGGNFKNGAVKLNHPHCARFCVLGGGSCSA